MGLTKNDLKEISKLFDKKFDSIDKRFDSMDKRLDSIDTRLDSMDKRFEGIDKRLYRHDDKFESLVKLINESHHKLDDKINKNTRIILKLSGEINGVKADTEEINEKFDFINKMQHNHEGRLRDLEKAQPNFVMDKGSGSYKRQQK